MTIEEYVQALLVAALPAYGSPATMLVPAARIKTPGDWQNLPRPYVIHFPVSVAPIYTHGGLARMTPWPFYQVTVVGDNYPQARNVVNAIIPTLVEAAGEAKFFWRGMNALPFDFDRKVIEVAMDFEVFEAL